MNKLMEDVELAERFIHGKMDDAERKKIATRLDNDIGFNKLVQDMSILVDGIKVTGSQTTIEEKIKKLKSFSIKDENTFLHPERKVINLFRWKLSRQQAWFALAASISLLAFVLIAIVNQGNLFGKPDLY